MRALIATCTSLLVMVSLAQAQETRTWAKYHVRVHDKAGVLMGAVTHITTHDESEPSILRTLFVDDEGNRAVVRQTLNAADGSGTLRIEWVGTSESAEFTWGTDDTDPTILTVNGESIQYVDDDEGTVPVRTQALALLTDHATSEFSSVMENVARFGTYHWPQFGFVSTRLKGVFYGTIQGSLGNVDEIVSEVVPDFDPQTTPPSAFDQLFGDAYFE